MENASDALKMAFAVFVFIIALTMVFSLISKVKETADAILLNSDRITYMEAMEGNLEERKNSRCRYSNISNI